LKPLSGVVQDGAVDRTQPERAVVGDPEALRRLEAITHPLVFADRAAFFAAAALAGAPVIVIDVPLLFETGGDRMVHAVAVVSAAEAVQRERVLARPGMTPAKFEAILARQTPDAEKQARADFVIDTGSGLAPAEAQVATILSTLKDPDWRSGRPDRLDPPGEPRQD
jgi:dephospho-CoA kinase